MTAVDEIKNKIQRLFHTDPIIHIDVSMNRPKIRIANQEARIKGVYSNVFQIEAQHSICWIVLSNYQYHLPVVRTCSC